MFTFPNPGATQVLESPIIPAKYMYRDKINNRILVSDDGTYYKILFIDGVTKESLDIAFGYAEHKLIHSIAVNMMKYASPEKYRSLIDPSII